MKKTFIVFLFMMLCLAFNGSGQNLVINPSFEDTIPCNQVNYPPSLTCYPWFMATAGSTDYFSEINQCWHDPAPQSIFGFQYAKTGVA